MNADGSRTPDLSAPADGISAPRFLVLIDGNSLLYRAFFALPPLTNPQGEVTNAAYGFTMMLLKVLDEQQPDMIAVAFDLPGSTFRHELFDEYKATRRAMPDELAPQMGMAREILEAMRIPIYQMEGYEADDVIGTLSAQAEQQGHRVLIVTGDLDELQLISKHVSVMVTRRGITNTHLYDVAAVKERYGLAPEQLADYRALRGDTSDNIPGVPGIGEKTSAQLIAQFGTLENLLANIEEVKPPRIAAALQAHVEIARRAKDLSVIVRDLLIEFDPEKLRVQEPDRSRLIEIFRRHDFRSLVKRSESPTASVVEGDEERASAAFKFVRTIDAAEAVAADLAGVEQVIVQVIDAGGTAMCAPLLGLAVSAGGTSPPVPLSKSGEGVAKPGVPDEEPAVIIGAEPHPPSPLPVHREGGTKLEVRETREEPTVIIGANDSEVTALLTPLKPILESDRVAKIGHDLKRTALVLACHGIELAGLSFDTMIAAHLVNPTRPTEALSAVAFDYLEAETPKIAKDSAPDPTAIAVAIGHVAALKDLLEQRLDEMGLTSLFRDLEMPLISVLIEMERTGVAIDSGALAELSAKLGARSAELEREIWIIAGEEFNISSPVQLRRILFEKLMLPPDKTKRTKSGYSTAADVLAGLSDYKIVAKILEYREVTKLKSTYVDALPPLVNPRTGRIHTSFNQAVTATGRLSSTNPNLQNIPIRSASGMEIRRAFITSGPGLVLLSADYSQIELRILAHITGDENLIEVFVQDEDLHRAAAMEIFGVEHDGVTGQMRAFAKMVNFGIPYGISDFRLAREMSIPIEEARRYMARYFERFPKVQQYVHETPERARELGYVTTLMGRRRPIPDLRSRRPSLRQAAERVAINTPMQGSAADIIKLAMLRLHDALEPHPLSPLPVHREGGARPLHTRMILQVHDELLFELPESELIETARLVEECMSSAYALRVPLKVDVKAGRNWLEMVPVL